MLVVEKRVREDGPLVDRMTFNDDGVSADP